VKITGAMLPDSASGASRHDPLVRLTSDASNQLEVGVVEDNDEITRLRCCCHKGVGQGEGSMLAGSGKGGLDLQGSTLIGVRGRDGWERRKAVRYLEMVRGAAGGYPSSNWTEAQSVTRPSATSGTKAAATAGFVRRAKMLVSAR
jgi:hypothetical protein